jgi:hypothetical protein
MHPFYGSGTNRFGVYAMLWCRIFAGTLTPLETLMHFLFSGLHLHSCHHLSDFLLMVFVVVMFSGLLKVQFQ